ncbi:MAG: hypothetical protein ACK5YD_03995 [Phenylobacterium sp.]
MLQVRLAGVAVSGAHDEPQRLSYAGPVKREHWRAKNLPQIDWIAFTWEAFATLATGAGAVAAAVVIGLRQSAIAGRQAAIADRQSRILEKQVHLEELKLRSELFERRFAVYQATRSFCSVIMAHADEPEQKVQQEFLTALDQSKFLFRPSVHDDLKELWKRSCGFFATKSVMKHKYETTGDYGQDNIDREYAYLNWLTERLDSLSELFGEEAKLSGQPAHAD